MLKKNRHSCRTIDETGERINEDGAGVGLRINGRRDGTGREELPFILLADNGFRDYYKPADALFEAVAAGRVLILSPREYDEAKQHVSREECVAMNGMAEEICESN